MMEVWLSPGSSPVSPIVSSSIKIEMHTSVTTPCYFCVPQSLVLEPLLFAVYVSPADDVASGLKMC